MYESESGSEKSPQDHDIHNPNRRKHTVTGVIIVHTTALL